jgi:hypothetical protein
LFLGGAGLGLLAALSCRAPTRIVVRVVTDVDCGRESPTPIITVGPVETGSEEPPAMVKVRCRASSDQGTVVVVPPPSAERDTIVQVRVAMRYRSDLAPSSEECSLASSALCIVQRRKLRFEPGGTIDLPMELNAICRDVYCSALQTCNRAGQCVSSEVRDCGGRPCDPTAVGPDGSPLAPDAGRDGAGPSDASGDGTVDPADGQADATTDTGTDGGADGAKEGGSTSSDGGPPTNLTLLGQCAGCAPGLDQCCMRTSPSHSTLCWPEGNSCFASNPVQHPFGVFCRTQRECEPSSKRCCFFNASVTCQDLACDAICSSDEECKKLDPQFTCRVSGAAGYATCGPPGPR